MSEDDATRMVYEARIKAQKDEYSRIQGARRDGREEGWKDGRTEGRTEGRQEVILQMAGYGMDIKAIAAVTRLSEGEISDIVKEKKA
jgi:predicted transposase/invertase (TIGR01784 family)